MRFDKWWWTVDRYLRRLIRSSFPKKWAISLTSCHPQKIHLFLLKKPQITTRLWSEKINCCINIKSHEKNHLIFILCKIFSKSLLELGYLVPLLWTRKGACYSVIIRQMTVHSTPVQLYSTNFFDQTHSLNCFWSLYSPLYYTCFICSFISLTKQASARSL